jgi:hypothetical protein
LNDVLRLVLPASPDATVAVHIWRGRRPAIVRSRRQIGVFAAASNCASKYRQ